jgi:hypothetical protein
MTEWPELSGIHDGIPPPPGPEIVRTVLARAAHDRVETPARPRPYRAWVLLTMEARLLHPAIWMASALIMVAGVGFTLARSGASEFVLALAVPLIAAAGVAGSYGPENDRAFELVAVTPTSPRVILLARVTLVFGYDLILALLSSAVLALLNATPLGLTSLIMTWLGPMATLSALSLLLSVCWNPEGATGVALALWSVHALAFAGVPVLEGLQGLWTTGSVTVVLALALTLAAVIAVGKGEPIRRARATHRL